MLRPHTGTIFLDVVDGLATVTNIVTCERQDLPPSQQWEMTYDEDGFAFCVGSQGAVIAVEDLMQFEVYDAAGKGAIILGRVEEASGQKVVLDVLKTKFYEIDASFPVGCTKAKKTLGGVVLRWPRAPAAKVLWNCTVLYEQLGLSQFGGQAWRWTAGSLGRWKKDMSSLGFGSHVLRSIQCEATLGALCGTCVSNQCVGQPYMLAGGGC